MRFSDNNTKIVYHQLDPVTYLRTHIQSIRSCGHLHHMALFFGNTRIVNGLEGVSRLSVVSVCVRSCPVTLYLFSSRLER